MRSPDPTLVLVHGFTQTGASWRPVIEHLQVAGPVVTWDAPGHGSAGAVRADLCRCADLLAESIGPEPAVVVGYSMGGRIALRLVLDHPEAVRALILLGATAGIDDDEQRAARRASDETLARRIEADGVDAFLDEWLALPLFRGLVPAADDLAARRANTREGLASSLRRAGTGTMDPPWWDELPGIEVPVLVAWGRHDAKFAAEGRRLAEAIGPGAATVAIPDAGHAAHLEQPAAFAATIDRFVTSIRG